MKLKQDFVLRNVAGSWVVLPVGQSAVNFNGMLSLNEVGAFLWNVLQETGGDAATLAEALQGEYDVDASTALTDAEQFLSRLEQAGCLEQA